MPENSLPDEGWQGVKLGVSIPLWENRNRVKHARAEVAAAEQAMDDARLQYSARLEFLFEQCRELTGNISRYESVFEKTATMSFFTGLFTGGELFSA